MAKIESLTPEQWAEVHQHRDQVIERCLNQPLDHNKIGQSIGACYEAVGEKPPLAIVWAPGPVAALAWSAILRAEGEKPEARQLWDQLGDQLNGAIASGWWLTDYEFWLHIAQISGITPPDEATLSLARQAADMLTPTMIIPLRGVCIAVDQHTALHRDNRNRLHCTDGAAWAWADGTQIYALDGIRVPEWVVRRPDPKRIISDELPNTEQRRVAMAHYGWDRAVDDLNLKIIEASDNPVWGTLYALPETLVERGQATLLVCQNASPDRDGTVRTYGLLASSEARTVVAAQASLAQLSESEWLTLEGAS